MESFTLIKILEKVGDHWTRLDIPQHLNLLQHRCGHIASNFYTGKHNLFFLVFINYAATCFGLSGYHWPFFGLSGYHWP
jgi:hypothetical protein